MSETNAIFMFLDITIPVMELKRTCDPTPSATPASFRTEPATNTASFKPLFSLYKAYGVANSAKVASLDIVITLGWISIAVPAVR